MFPLRRPPALLGLLIVALLAALVRLQPAHGLPPRDAEVSIAAARDGVAIAWAARGGAPAWPLVEIGSARVPARLLTFEVPGSAPVTPQIRRVVAHPWQGAPPATVEPALLHGGGGAPDAPVVVLREGRYRGARLVVVAVAALYQRDGAWYAVDALDAALGGARQLTAAALPAGLWAAEAASLAPVNPMAAAPALKLTVAQSGIQRVTGAALAAAGLDLAAVVPARLHLRVGGVEVPLEERGTADGRLDPGDELRFYAAAPGDRWNATATYWLAGESTPGARMQPRAVALDGAAPYQVTGVEQGAWQRNALYDSTRPGVDGDHWFAVDLRSSPGKPSAPLDVPLPASLPSVAGSVQLVITGDAYTPGTHRLTITIGATSSTATWSGRGAWTQTFTLPANGATARVVLEAGSAADGVEVDHVRWERAAGLQLGGSGAQFRGVPGAVRYQLTQLPSSSTLYDVTDPAQPAVLASPSGASLVFADGPAARSYLVSGPGTLWTPAVAAHAPVAVLAPLNADLVYIAPAAFHAALAPLVAHRTAQGHSVAVVDVQALFDTWSYGHVAPAAIREFLRYAAATWAAPPVAATLVGDGTSDPLNYTGRNNTNFIPPYLAPVDPWLGETACETCYGQLDGADPLDDALPDVQIGRLPVKSVAELQGVVGKIVGYETAPRDLGWQARNVFIADNADGAGDFAAFADAAAALQPPGVDVERVYYDPGTGGEPWREANAGVAYQRTLAALRQGAAIVNYVGHSNNWQWAVTDPTQTPGYLLGLYDVDALGNAGKLPVVLEMTCYTSAFQQPAYSGTTIDERFVLAPNGGAVAVWGPTGLGIAHGHDAMQRGFYAALWSASGTAPALGSLVDAGYMELFTSAGCCQDTLRTFALLGDPATGLRAAAPRRIWLPVVQR